MSWPVRGSFYWYLSSHYYSEPLQTHNGISRQFYRTCVKFSFFCRLGVIRLWRLWCTHRWRRFCQIPHCSRHHQLLKQQRLLMEYRGASRQEGTTGNLKQHQDWGPHQVRHLSDFSSSLSIYSWISILNNGWDSRLSLLMYLLDNKKVV